MVFDNGVFAEGLRPEEVRLAEDTTKESACDTQEDEHEVMYWIVINLVVGFKALRTIAAVSERRKALQRTFRGKYVLVSCDESASVLQH